MSMQVVDSADLRRSMYTSATYLYIPFTTKTNSLNFFNHAGLRSQTKCKQKQVGVSFTVWFGNSTQREFTDAGETPHCPHLFIKIKYKTIRHILLVLIYL